MKRKSWMIPLVILVLLLGAFFIYTGIYYHAEPSAQKALESGGTVTVTQTECGWLFDGPSERDALIFYPGAKVEETSYAPMLRTLAEKGIDVFLVRMPFRLAIFGKNLAGGIRSSYPYDRWFIGGHSLGGAMAADYAAEHDDFDGTVLFAAYPTKQLPKDDLEIVIYGSEDGVLNMEKLEKGRAYAPVRVRELRIEGGNHAQFGNYGIQSGDGEARISAQRQQEETAEFISAVISENR